MKRSPITAARCVPLLLALLLATGVARATSTDLATAPLATSATTAVLPNLMFILDDSGSMAWDYLPDNVQDSSTAKTRCANSNCNSTGTAAAQGDPPYYAAQFNGVFYNPQITYLPGVNADGTSMGSYGSPWTSVKVDPYTSSSTIDLTGGFPEIVYCKNSNDTPTNTTNCRRNGIDTATPFIYDAGTSNGFPNGSVSSSSTNFKYPRTRNGNPFYYTITPREYCSDTNLVNCTLSTTPTGSYTIPAPVRYCSSSTMQNNAAAVSGVSSGTNKCQKKLDSGHSYVRYGYFTRTDIVSTTTTYGSRPNRTDCAAAPNCTYAEEMTNFANWYAYYRTRIQMMKSSAGRAFMPIDSHYRVGFITINPGSPVSSSKYLKIATFDSSQKSNWYSKLYGQTVNNSTPLREALSRIGRHYAGITTGINNGMPEDPVQYSCQQNFALMTTDGYWNGNGGVKLDGSAMDNQDNSDGGYSTRAIGAYDGNLSGSSGTLADVAMYYYKTDLRTSGSVSTDNVPTTPQDGNPKQHMVTFTLGLGLDGLMDYRSDYMTATSGDFANIKSGSTGCSWASGVCNWPAPAADAPSALDDLWHAAVNGRGQYFSARDPNSLADGLSTALASMAVQVGAAAAAATSSPNITPSDNYIYSSTYRTVKWDGEVVAQQIDTITGNVLPTMLWSAQTLLDARVAPSADTRTIYTFSSTTPNKLKSFDWTSLSAAEQAYFTGKCSALTQCSSLNTTQQATANNGQNMVAFLRGRTQDEGGVYRDRDHVLGDTVNAQPAFLRAPRYSFSDAVSPDYATFKAANVSRQGVLYIAANDGMVHAFNSDTGQEMWAYVPRIVMPSMYKLAEEDYGNHHTFLVDGSPKTMDIFANGAWKTILVGGLNSGGRGYYALDVTDPANPAALWEFCSDSTLCANYDTDLGYSYGPPVITKRAVDGKWVVIVTSGYNNVSPGTGHGVLFVLDAATGNVLERVDTGVGDTTTPSGLGKIAAWAANGSVDNTGLRVYSGDLLGNVWRFDLGTSPVGVTKLAQLKDGSGKYQSITAKPELGSVQGYPVVFVGTGRYLGVTDLSDPATLTPVQPYSYQQSIYGFKDGGAALGDIRAGGQLVQQTIIPIDAVTRTASTNAVDWSTKLGWYLDFNPGGASPGERVNLDPQLVLGTLVVTTNVPAASACTIGGDSWQYQLNYSTGSYVLSSPQHAIGNKLANALTVGNVIVRLPAGQLKDVATDAAGVKRTYGINVGGSAVSGKRVMWRELTQ
ncbi:MAG TPA: PilC/PilY family type IV pilus protein [Burkholderiales bacterium]|nr:PilC/PilY family type IV pilus protein [Burkholderiales bacterium]